MSRITHVVGVGVALALVGVVPASGADFDGDGRADLAIGAPGESLTGARHMDGAVNIVYGGERAPRQLTQSDAGGATENGDSFGGAVAVGDFDGDGRSDLAVGTRGEALNNNTLAGAGVVNVVYGGARAAQQISQSDAGGATEADDFFGETVAVGDFDGDGFDDLAVGAPHEQQGPTLVGAVNLVYGSATGLGRARARQLFQGDAGGVTEADRFGAALAVGDFDDDGRDDLAIGAPFEDLGALDSAGVVNVVFGGARAPRQLTQSDLGGATEANDRFGTALAAGDFDGDGVADLAVGAPTEALGGIQGAGAANVVHGRAGLPLGGAGARVHQYTQADLAGAIEADDHFGAVLAAGDLDDDGAAELAVGVPDEDVGTITGAGAVNVRYGDPLSPTVRQFHQTTGPEPDDAFGAAVTIADGALVVGVPGERPASGAAGVGEVDLVSDAEDVLRLATQDDAGGFSEAFDAFGASLAS